MEENVTVLPIGEEQLRAFMETLRRYSAGLRKTRSRIIASENWWKLRNTREEGGFDGYRSVSGWLHNVIVSKHADLMENYPEPVILPREEGDREEARILSAVVPCILEQNHFDAVYSDAMWQKCKSGTACYKIVWDSSLHGGLGDIAIHRVDLLNLYWEPGIGDIQKSRYLFHTELRDKDLLLEEYPQLQGKMRVESFLDTKFLYDDQVDTSDKATVVEVYYHKGGVLHYCKFVGDTVLFATENQLEPTLTADGQLLKAPMAQTGLYDHGKYPFDFDPLFPIEGSPCGYGYVDVCRSPQTEIDLMKTSFVRNAQVGATPRFFSRQDGAVNEAEFLDLRKPIVHVAGNLGEDSLRQIPFNALDGTYLSMLDRTIQELRETSGNTETSTGNIASGVTAASAIAALQEASGKGSRDTVQAGYRSFGRIVEMVIELIRQFYDLPRKFRILGRFGAEEFVSFDNSALQPQPYGEAFGRDMGLRLPVFDIKITAQKRNSYTRMTQNELALQFFQLGFFDPQRSDQAMQCLEMMEFEGKDQLLRRLSESARQWAQAQAETAGKFPELSRQPLEELRLKAAEGGME